MMQTAPAAFPNPPALSGTWSNGARWNFHLSAEPVPLNLVTSVFCAAITPEGIVLTTTERGYDELLGGHLEPGETVEIALDREALEEGGVQLQIWAKVGICEIFNQQGVINKTTGEPYPARSFMPFFVGFSSLPLQEPNGSEVQSRRVLTIAEALSLDASAFPGRPVLEVMLKNLFESAGEAIPGVLASLQPREIEAALRKMQFNSESA